MFRGLRQQERVDLEIRNAQADAILAENDEARTSIDDPEDDVQYDTSNPMYQARVSIRELEGDNVTPEDTIVYDDVPPRPPCAMNATTSMWYDPADDELQKFTFETYTCVVDAARAELNAYRPKIGFLNVGGFFDPFFAFLRNMIAEGYVEEHLFEYFVVENSGDGEALLDKIDKFVIPEPITKLTWSSPTSY